MGDSLGGCGVRQGGQLLGLTPAFPTEIYLQGCFKPLVSISPNDRLSVLKNLPELPCSAQSPSPTL